jgi:hypothetical protein
LKPSSEFDYLAYVSEHLLPLGSLLDTEAIMQGTQDYNKRTELYESIIAGVTKFCEVQSSSFGDVPPH